MLRLGASDVQAAVGTVDVADFDGRLAEIAIAPDG
jgi:hypothetical protein